MFAWKRCNPTLLATCVGLQLSKGSRLVRKMSEKHLSKGSTNPPTKPGLLRLYSMRFCPYAQRILLVLDMKKIPYEVVNVDLTQKPEWLFDKSPLGKVPALESEGEVIYESLIIAEYLEDKYPKIPLYPKDPMKKAKDKLMIDQFGKVVSAMLRMMLNPHMMDREHMDDLMNHMDKFEAELVRRSEPFFSGKKPGMLDLMIWPWCERYNLLRIFGGDQFVIPPKRFMRLMEWAIAMKEDDAVKVSYLPPEVHAKYLESRLSGYPDYNFLVKSNL